MGQIIKNGISYGGGAGELSSMLDVSLDNITDGQALVYDAESQKWVNGDVVSSGTITTNLLKPTLQTTTINGVTCTNNGDGTFTLNGTNSTSSTLNFNLCTMYVPNKDLYLLGSNQPSTVAGIGLAGDTSTQYSDIGYHVAIADTDKNKTITFSIKVKANAVCNNIIMKPMLTTDASATYNDFVPYTGGSDTLQSDVAQVADDVINLKILGWTVPKEMSVKNYVDADGIFHQKVGRVDLGSFNWTYRFDRWYAPIADVAPPLETWGINVYINGYTTVKKDPGAQSKTVSIGGISTGVYGVFINNGSTTTSPNGCLYYELITEKTYLIDGNEIATDTLNLKMLGYTVPHELGLNNYVDNDGVFHQRVDRVDLGSLGWSYNSTNKRFQTTTILQNAKGGSSSKTYSRVSKWEYTNNDKTNYISTSKYIILYDSSYTDAAAFKSAVSGVYLYYELETEITKNVDGHEHEWELIGSVVGSSELAIDCGKYSEFNVIQTYSTWQYSHRLISADVAKYTTSSNAYADTTGGAYSSTNLVFAQIRAYKNGILNALMGFNGNNYTSSTTMTVYGRR